MLAQVALEAVLVSELQLELLLDWGDVVVPSRHQVEALQVSITGQCFLGSS